MPYANFTEAFNTFSSTYLSVNNALISFNNAINSLQTQTTINGVRNYTKTALITLSNALVAHVSPGGFGPDYTWSSHYMSTYYAWSEGGSSTVDMDAILNAMLASNFNQLTQFMGILEAYKLAVWNAPFNAEYYAALARGFVKWQ